MPLELGMAMAKKFLDPAAEHDWLVMVPKNHAYLRFISDLAAYDPATHEGTVESVALPDYRVEKKKLEESWGQDAPWPDVVSAASRIAKLID